MPYTISAEALLTLMIRTTLPIAKKFKLY